MGSEQHADSDYQFGSFCVDMIILWTLALFTWAAYTGWIKDE